MATFVALVQVPCKQDPAQTAVNVPNCALVFRAPLPVPLNLSSGAATPKGPQVWPI